MAFSYLSGSGISDIIFNTILKINPTLLSKYTSVTDQAFYLLLIPSVFIILFVWTFGYWFVGKSHNGLRILISMIAYIYVVYSGWYGSFMVSLILAWFPVILISYFGFFIITKILHPGNVQGLNKVVDAGFKKIKEANANSKEIETTEKNIEILKRKIKDLEAKQMSMERAGNPRAVADIITVLSQLEHQKIDQEEHLKRLEGN
jgi:hypothetical protein